MDNPEQTQKSPYAKTALILGIFTIFILVFLVITNQEAIKNLFFSPPVYAPRGEYTKVGDFRTRISFRSHMVINQNKLYVLAKDSSTPSDSDNKEGGINIYEYDGSSSINPKGTIGDCLDGQTPSIALGNYSDPISKGPHIFFGTYPNTGFASYNFDTQKCTAIFYYNWGSDSTWRTASRGVEFNGNIYFVAYRMYGEDDTKYEETVYYFDASSDISPDKRPTLSTIKFNGKEGYYPHGDGRDPTQGPIGVIGDKLYFVNGEFDRDGFTETFDDLSSYTKDDSNGLQPMNLKDNQFHLGFSAGYVDEKTDTMYLAGTRVDTKQTIDPTGISRSNRFGTIVSYQGDDYKFTDINNIKGNYLLSARAIIVSDGNLYVAWRGQIEEDTGKAPIKVYELQADGSGELKDTIGDSNFEVHDFEIFNGEVYALAHRTGTGEGQVWKINKQGNGAHGPSEGEAKIESFTSPVDEVYITQDFGESPWEQPGGEDMRYFHTGIDLGMPQPIYAAGPGLVVEVKYSNTGYGNNIVIEHTLLNGEKVLTRYAHLRTSYVAQGQRVERGQRIGMMGKTGNVRCSPETQHDENCGIHLHFELMICKYYSKECFIDPTEIVYRPRNK